MNEGRSTSYQLLHNRIQNHAAVLVQLLFSFLKPGPAVPVISPEEFGWLDVVYLNTET